MMNNGDGGLGYPGGRSGHMGSYDNDSFRGTGASQSARGVGYAGGRTGHLAMTDNDALRGLGNDSGNIPPRMMFAGMGLGTMALLGVVALLVLRK